MRHSNRIVLSLSIALCTLLISCNQPSSTAQPSNDSTTLDDKWNLNLINGRPLISDSSITLVLKGKSFNGFSGCNRYGGNYTATASAFEVNSIDGTVMPCETPEGVMQQEELYLQALKQIATYRVVDNHLGLENDTGNATLVFERGE